ncbi:MarR family winged helix-turn-helix transcriptional regulator [Thermostaphylospora chromogena]|uniref:MarR family transcriptional regulator, transcriptional regulator for hemolysin n=1 Tax=Thermostaphylospora chromogena TaxID=35622 RepID=A0A1H1H803_9ACTN|nr:MarR family winged helix-turn-helix transcriptional regulator [Thermostaphylospora chromogena]SDR21216.1 MarR family transcriptional regulator, transcriptional regulator for hemolysin [Thermostaphylospora chromogena]
MSSPALHPIGLHLSRVAEAVNRAFDDALAEAGGSLPVWLILTSLKTRRLGDQRELADAVGLSVATLTHHLNTMERAGLLTRRRDPANRRVHLVEPTPAGEDLFHRLRAAAVDFDRRLRTDLSEEEIATLTRLLTAVEENVRSGAERLPSDRR